MIASAVKNGTDQDPRALLLEKTVAEFFAGIGLMRLALERQGWTVAFANDIDPKKHETYRAHFGDAGTHFLCEDVHKISVERVPAVTLATASFPCNDLSLAGARQGLWGKESSAFWGFIRVLEEMGNRRPPLVLLENVTGFLTSHKGEDFKQAMLALNGLGYAVDAFMLDAACFVPQSRERLFVVGASDAGFTARDWGCRALYYETDLRPKALLHFILAHPEIRWQVRDLPSQPRRTTRLSEILEDLDETAPEWWSAERAEYLFNQMSARHRKLAGQMAAYSEWSYGTVFRRMRHGKSTAELRTDGLAGCLRTPRGGSGRQILFKAGYGKYFARLLTPRECARLMGADDYKIAVPLNQALFGFGDAVCVPVIEWVVKHYLNPLANELAQEPSIGQALQRA